MPVPRRFDRRPPERDTTRINERIRVPKVRLIGADGEQLGIVETPDALKRAQDADLDLVEVAPNSKPPVTRLLDYSKYKYEQEQKQKAARKHQQQVNVREIKLRPKIADHDYETKNGHVERFLRQHNKVKITIMFRGREQAHPERGRALLQRLYEDLDGLAVIESDPLQEGREHEHDARPEQRDRQGQRGRGRGRGRQAGGDCSLRRRRGTTSAIRSAAWPSQRRGRVGAPGALGEGRRDPGDRGRVEAEQGVGPGSDRDRALGVVAQREAGDAEVGRLLLDPARVGEHGRRVGDRARGTRGSRAGRSGAAPGARRRARRASSGSAGGPGRRPASRRATAASAAIASPSSGPSTSAGRCSVTSR